MQTLPILEANLKRKAILKEKLPEGEGLKKKRGRPKKLNNAKALKDLGKRLTSQQKMAEKKLKLEQEKEKKQKKLKEEIQHPLQPLPPYKPSTEPTIKLELPKKGKWGEPTSTPHHFEEPLEHNEPPAYPADVHRRSARKSRAKKERIEESGPLSGDTQYRRPATAIQAKVRQVKAQKEFKTAKEGITKLQSKARQLSAKQKANALKAGKELAKEEKEMGEEEAKPLPTIKKLVLKTKPKAIPPAPSGPTPGEKGFWTGKEMPHYTGKGKHPPNYRAWIEDNPLEEESLRFFKSPSGKEFLDAHPEIKSQLPTPKSKGRPKKGLPPAPLIPPEQSSKALKDASKTIEYVKNALNRSAEKKEPEERPKLKRPPLPPARPSPSLRSSSSSSSEQAPSPRSSSSSRPPPSRIIPVAEDVKATMTSALTPEALLTLPQERLYGYRENYSGRSRDSSLEEGEIRGEGFDNIKWGSLTQQFNEYKKSHPEIKSLEEFAHHILSNPKKFHSRTVKRANFYKNVLQGKGLVEGDSDSDEEIISQHNIMPMTRPVSLHPALESSTMTMNPGAYNNIKPLMGALMGEGVGNHVHRLSHNGRTSSHYGAHASHPQMMPMGHYVKHPAMKGGAIEPTIDDLIHQGKMHLVDKFGIHPEQAHQLLHSAIHNGMDSIPVELHPLAHQGIDMGKHLINKIMGGNIFDDIGSKIKQGWEEKVEQPIKQGWEEKVVPEIPNIVHKANVGLNDPKTQMAMAGITSGLNSAGMPEVGIPLSVAYYGARQGANMADNHRNVRQQIDNQYLDPAKSMYHKITGKGVWDSLGDNVANNLGALANSGTTKLIDLMGNPDENPHSMEGKKGKGLKGKGVWDSLGNNVANNLGALANSGTTKLIDLMGNPDENPHSMEGKKGKGLKATGGEIGDGLYAQGRGFKKGSAEAKAHMAKLRAMRGKKMKGGALPPPSRSPITDPEINGSGLYA